MIDIITLIMLLGAGFVSLVDMKKGFLICVATGFLQDPLRKMVPNEPVYYTMLVGAMVAIAFIGAKLQGINLSFRPIHSRDNTLRVPLMLFFTVVLFQCLIAFINTGSVIVPAIGLVAYLSPIPALLLAYHYARDERSVLLFLQVYLVFSMLMLSGVYLSVLGYDWGILKPVGKGMAVYTTKGRLELPGGFFRASEVAAWHAAAAICFLIILSTVTKKQSVTWINSLFIVFLLGALLLTGRRKMVLEIIMFIPTFALFIAWFRGGSKKLIAPVALVALMVFVVAFGDILPDKTSETAKPFLERAGSLQATGDPLDRLLHMSVYSVKWVVLANGFFGSGAGTGSQGSQHFGAGATITGAAAEGGLAKVLAELGVPGLCVFFWFMYRFMRYLVRVMASAKNMPPEQGNLIYGIMAFLAANSVVFVTASQIYGDVFVLLMLGWLVGIVLAIPRMLAVPAVPARTRVRAWGEGTPLEPAAEKAP